MRKQRIDRQMTRECALGGAKEALIEICRALDIPAPLWLPKHEREFDNFRMTAFARDHFLEEVPFDRLEIELIDGGKRKSRDPRNDFGF